jgi:acyl-CoA thioester hydrolase
MAPLPKHIESFKVRHHECGAFGHLNNAVYLRYMQEAGIGASNAIGLDEAAYRSLKRLWLPRMTNIEYLRPVRHGDEIDVLTWVDSARRVQSRRMYEFRRKGDPDPFAKAYTDWVFIDSEKMIPATIPLDIMDLFLPNRKRIPREKFPDTPTPPDEIFRVHRSVEWSDVDPQGHLNNAAYLDYAEDCAIRFSKSQGWPMKKWMERGISFVAHQTRIEYLIPAGLDVELEIGTWLYNLRRAGVSRHYAFTNSDTEEFIARMQTKWVMIDLQSGNPTRIPGEVHEFLLQNLSSP